jgi:septum formation protein
MSRPRFVLASASPRRLELLARIGLTPDTVDPAALDEAPRAGERAEPHVRRLSAAKAAAVAARHSGAVVLAADTIVAAGARILPKAADAAEVAACLRLLSGRRHRVLTAVTLIDSAGTARHRLGTAIVRLPLLGDAAIAAYAACGEGEGKAGGYAIQGRFEAHVAWIAGSHSAIVGLPLFETRALLRAAGLLG